MFPKKAPAHSTRLDFEARRHVVGQHGPPQRSQPRGLAAVQLPHQHDEPATGGPESELLRSSF